MKSYRAVAIVTAAMLLLASPALAGGHNHGDPAGRALDKFTHQLDATNKKIDATDSKLAKLAAKDQSNQKILDREAVVQDKHDGLEAVAAALQAAIDAL